MAKNKISEWSSTPANNTDVGGIDIAEGCAPSGINNAIREMMAQIKDMQAGTDGDTFTVGGNLSVSGTSTLTGAVTASGGVSGNLTGNVTGNLTGASTGAHNGTVGATTPTTVVGTTITANSGFVGNLTGNVTGNASGLSATLAVASGGTGSTSLTANNVLLGNGTSAVQVVAPGTSGNLLTSNGTTWTSAPLNFGKSLSTNGYQEFPGGLIIQWGTSTTISNGGSETITFPKAFTTSVFQIQRSENRNSGYTGGSESWLTSITTTSFVLNHRGFDTYTGSMSYYWFAIGY